MLLAMQPIFTGAIGLERLGYMERARWLGSIDYLQQYDLLARPVLPEDVMTNHLIERAYNSTSR